jgi:hypothetical protein
MSLKYYLYLSESKIDMLFAQIPRAFLSGVSGELAVSLGFLSTKLKQDAEAMTKYSKLSVVLSYLEQHHDVGTVDQPAEYFKGTMELKWGQYNNYEEEVSPLVYFGGRTEQTILGLGGSSQNVVGATGSGIARSHSVTPYLVARLYEELEMTLSTEQKEYVEMVKRDHDDSSRYIAMAVDLATTQMSGENQRVEFIARRLAYFQKGDHGGWSKDMNILLGTPLYVAAAD